MSCQRAGDAARFKETGDPCPFGRTGDDPGMVNVLPVSRFWTRLSRGRSHLSQFFARRADFDACRPLQGGPPRTFSLENYLHTTRTDWNDIMYREPLALGLESACGGKPQRGDELRRTFAVRDTGRK